jgi:hypothetical protein
MQVGGRDLVVAGGAVHGNQTPQTMHITSLEAEERNGKKALRLRDRFTECSYV